MNDLIQPPTDNLYKFLAIGTLLLTVVAFYFFLHDLNIIRDQFVAADIELKAHGYVDTAPPPTEVELRRAFFLRQNASSDAENVMRSSAGRTGKLLVGLMLVTSAFFVLWWMKVQRIEDKILILTAKKLELEIGKLEPNPLAVDD